MAAFGRIDALVCNTGIMRNAFIEEIAGEDWASRGEAHPTALPPEVGNG